MENAHTSKMYASTLCQPARERERKIGFSLRVRFVLAHICFADIGEQNVFLLGKWKMRRAECATQVAIYTVWLKRNRKNDQTRAEGESHEANERPEWIRTHNKNNNNNNNATPSHRWYNKYFTRRTNRFEDIMQLRSELRKKESNNSRRINRIIFVSIYWQVGFFLVKNIVTMHNIWVFLMFCRFYFGDFSNWMGSRARIELLCTSLPLDDRLSFRLMCLDFSVIVCVDKSLLVCLCVS